MKVCRFFPMLYGVAAVLFVSAAGCGPDGDAQDVDTTSSALSIAGPNAKYHGKTYSEWAANWWQWTLRIPSASNPQTNPDADCDVDQSGSVFFLAGSYGGTETRSCRVPANKALFFPVYNNVWLQTLSDPQLSTRELRAEVAPPVDIAIISAEIDGHRVANPYRYREQSEVFTAKLPVQDNTWGYTVSECPLKKGFLTCTPALDDGYYLLIDDLSRGRHTIHFTAQVPDSRPGEPPIFALDVTYHLTVGR